MTGAPDTATSAAPQTGPLVTTQGLEVGYGGRAILPPLDIQTGKVVRGRIEQKVKARGIVKPAPNALVRIGFPMPKDVARRIQGAELVIHDDAGRGGIFENHAAFVPKALPFLAA